MDLMESFRTLRRHWVLTTALLLLTLLGVAAAAVKLPWTYQSVATVVLLNSKTASTPTGNNPYLAFAPSLTQAAEVVSLDATDPRTAQALQARGYPDGYLIAISSVTGAPIMQITVTGHNATTVEHTLYGVIQVVNTKLRDLQSGITPQNLIKDQVVSVAPQASRSISKKAKPLVVILALGLVLTFAIPHIVDSVARRRLRRETTAASQVSGYSIDETNYRRPNGRVPVGSGMRASTRRSTEYKSDPDSEAPLTRDAGAERARFGRRR
jgi:hypothetical protein